MPDGKATTRLQVDLTGAKIAFGTTATLRDVKVSLDLTCADGSCTPKLTFGGTLNVAAPVHGQAVRRDRLGRDRRRQGHLLDLGHPEPILRADQGRDGQRSDGQDRPHGGRHDPRPASGILFGASVDIDVHFGDDGSWAQATVKNWTPFAGAPTFASMDVVYSKTARTVKLGDGSEPGRPRRHL